MAGIAISMPSGPGRCMRPIPAPFAPTAGDPTWITPTAGTLLPGAVKTGPQPRGMPPTAAVGAAVPRPGRTVLPAPQGPIRGFREPRASAPTKMRIPVHASQETTVPEGLEARGTSIAEPAGPTGVQVPPGVMEALRDPTGVRVVPDGLPEVSGVPVEAVPLEASEAVVEAAPPEASEAVAEAAPPEVCGAVVEAVPPEAVPQDAETSVNFPDLNLKYPSL